METQENKELIYIKPPAHHFERAAIAAVAAKAFEQKQLHVEAAQMKTIAVYETALGFESLVYRSCCQPT